MGVGEGEGGGGIAEVGFEGVDVVEAAVDGVCWVGAEDGEEDVGDYFVELEGLLEGVGAGGGHCFIGRVVVDWSQLSGGIKGWELKSEEFEELAVGVELRLV